MAKDETLFSKVFRGFSPDEVIAYIDELNAVHRSSRTEYEAKVNALNDELASLKSSVMENAALKTLNEEKDAVVLQLNAEIERLNNDNENQRLAMSAQSERN